MADLYNWCVGFGLYCDLVTARHACARSVLPGASKRRTPAHRVLTLRGKDRADGLTGALLAGRYQERGHPKGQLRAGVAQVLNQGLGDSCVQHGRARACGARRPRRAPHHAFDTGMTPAAARGVSRRPGGTSCARGARLTAQ
jgi:hypothetical protein